jgi:hypothetical protein
MIERVKSILGAISKPDLGKIAAGALGAERVWVHSAPELTPLPTPADARTIGVVKVTGTAERPDGGAEHWSAVAKVVDFAIATIGEVQWTRPEIEEIVYEEGYFAGEGLPFRPARCYLVSRPADRLTVIWLEDLTDAGQPPFSVDELAEMARHLGEWSGAHRTIPDLKFPLPDDVFATRWAMPVFLDRYQRLAALDPSAIHRFYRGVSVKTAETLRSLLLVHNERSKTLPHGLAFGDCHVGNLFHRTGETIAIDWATLANDPIGADAGSMIGSMLGWSGAIDVVRNERGLFDCYTEGLLRSGWRGSRDDVRRGYFCQFGHYLVTTVGLMPVVLANNEWPQEVLERRYQTSIDHIPDLLSQVIATYPLYMEELEALAQRP